MSKRAKVAALFAFVASASALATLPYAPLFSIQAPAELSNGEPMPSDGVIYRLFCGQGGMLNSPQLMYQGTDPQWQSAVDSFLPGDYECQATVAIGDGPQSEYSNAVAFTVAAPVPLPPVLQIQ